MTSAGRGMAHECTGPIAAVGFSDGSGFKRLSPGSHVECSIRLLHSLIKTVCDARAVGPCHNPGHRASRKVVGPHSGPYVQAATCRVRCADQCADQSPLAEMMIKAGPSTK